MKRSFLAILILALVLIFSFSCGDDDDDDNDSAPIENDDDDTNDDDDDISDDDETSDDDDDDNDDDDNDTDPGDPIVCTEDFVARQAEYLQVCSDNNGPGEGGMHGQVCRLVMGETTFDEEAIDESIEKISNREDCSDFDLNSIIRLLYLNRDLKGLPTEIEEDLKDLVLNFKYWLDEPNLDDMCWWSENHQLLFHTAELLAGQLYLDETFPNSGMTGQDHVDHALPRLTRWLNFRGQIGFAEFHSNVYFNEDMPPLTNLVDFAEDEAIATKAAMLLDSMAFDFANNYYKGLYATAHGRTYPSKFVGGLKDSTTEGAWMMIGIGDYSSDGNFSAVALSSSPNYCPPPILEDIANDALDNNVHKERDSITFEEAEDYGLGFTSTEDVLFWFSLEGYTSSEVIMGTFDLVEEFNLWETWFWKDVSFLRFLVGSPLLETVTEHYYEIAGGPALEAVNTYTYRTGDYQLSGAQDFKKGEFGAQTHIWQGTIDRQAYVFTTYPGGIPGDYIGTDWTGGWLPRVTLHENVGIIQYQRRTFPLLDALLFVDYTHAYFPNTEFDDVVESGNWTIGKKGDSYVALYSKNPVYWAESSPESDYELIADGKSNVWIVEMGSLSENGSFTDFTTAILNADVTINQSGTHYESPSIGTVEVAFDGPMTVDGDQVDIGPYERWDNAYAYQEFGTKETIIEFDNQRLSLDFEKAKRRYWENYSE